MAPDAVEAAETLLGKGARKPLALAAIVVIAISGGGGLALGGLHMAREVVKTEIAAGNNSWEFTSKISAIAQTAYATEASKLAAQAEHAAGEHKSYEATLATHSAQIKELQEQGDATSRKLDQVLTKMDDLKEYMQTRKR